MIQSRDEFQGYAVRDPDHLLRCCKRQEALYEAVDGEGGLAVGVRGTPLLQPQELRKPMSALLNTYLQSDSLGESEFQYSEGILGWGA